MTAADDKNPSVKLRPRPSVEAPQGKGDRSKPPLYGWGGGAGARAIHFRETTRAGNSITCLAVLLGGALAASLTVLYVAHNARLAGANDVGAVAFQAALTWVLIPVPVVFVPMRTFLSAQDDFSVERLDGLILTGISATDYAWGLMNSCYSAIGAVVAASVPAVATTYILRGFSIGAAFMDLLYVAFGGAGCGACAVAIAAFSRVALGRFGRARHAFAFSAFGCFAYGFYCWTESAAFEKTLSGGSPSGAFLLYQAPIWASYAASGITSLAFDRFRIASTESTDGEPPTPTFSTESRP